MHRGHKRVSSSLDLPPSSSSSSDAKTGHSSSSRPSARRRISFSLPPSTPSSSSSSSGHPSPQSSPEFSSPPHVRKQYVEWILMGCELYNLEPEVAVSAIQYTDSFFGLIESDKEDGEIREHASTPRERDAIAGAALLLADKFHSKRHPGSKRRHFLSYRHNWNAILTAEHRLIERLEWGLMRPSPIRLIEERAPPKDDPLEHRRRERDEIFRRLAKEVLTDPAFPNMTAEEAARRSLAVAQL